MRRVLAPEVVVLAARVQQALDDLLKAGVLLYHALANKS